MTQWPNEINESEAQEVFNDFLSVRNNMAGMLMALTEANDFCISLAFKASFIDVCYGTEQTLATLAHSLVTEESSHKTMKEHFRLNRELILTIDNKAS